MDKVQKRREQGRIRALTLLIETSLILIVFNASSYFGTTAYKNAIPSIGIGLAILLSLWIWINGRFRLGYDMRNLGLTSSSISRKQW